MNEIKDGGSAFPVPETVVDSDKVHQPNDRGMTLRDYFAAHAPDVPEDFGWATGETDSWQRRSRWNFHYADAMLREREN